MTRDLDWFPELPDKWQQMPLKAACEFRVSNVDKVPSEDELPVRLCNYTDVYHNEFITLDMELMETTATKGEIERFGLAVNDVVITKDSEAWNDIGVPAVIAETAPDLVCGYHLAMLRPVHDVLDGRYLFRCLQARPMQFQFERSASGVTRYGLGLDAIGRLYLPIPPLPRQRAIAAYLDRETAKIDAMIVAKERLLALLAEKRRALITHAVTRGLNLDASTKESGVEWLGDIPRHWRVMRGKSLFEQSRLPVRDEDEIVTCFRDGEVTLRKYRREEGFTNAVKELGYQGIREGHLVLHSMDAFAGAIGVSDSDGKCSPEYIICDPRSSDIVPKYFGHLMRVMALNGFIQASCPAVRERAPRIRFNDIASMYFVLPPRSEQELIVTTIGEQLEALSSLAAAAENSIRLSTERRSALIAAAVTGKIDVEDAA